MVLPVVLGLCPPNPHTNDLHQLQSYPVPVCASAPRLAVYEGLSWAALVACTCTCICPRGRTVTRSYQLFGTSIHIPPMCKDKLEHVHVADVWSMLHGRWDMGVTDQAQFFIEKCNMKRFGSKCFASGGDRGPPAAPAASKSFFTKKHT